MNAFFDLIIVGGALFSLFVWILGKFTRKSQPDDWKHPELWIRKPPASPR